MLVLCGVKGEELGEACSMHGIEEIFERGFVGKERKLRSPRLRCEYNIKVDL
jgi:hypothetical protein